jgi:hypothetical protein
VAEAQRLIEAWRIEYNEICLQRAFGNKTLAEYLLQAMEFESEIVSEDIHIQTALFPINEDVEF